MHHKQTVIIYHKRCEDGFGAAYAAWKKFGDEADYIPASYGDPIQPELAGKEIYLVDFCYEDVDGLAKLEKEAKRIVVLDHHESSRERVEKMREHVYDKGRSGASIAWAYFHPNTPLPRLIQCLEDGDLYRYSLPETRDIFSYLGLQPWDFHIWDATARKLEDGDERSDFLAQTALYTEIFKKMATMSIEAAKRVHFEGRECYFTTTLPWMTMRSYVGRELYTKLPPFALVVTAHPEGFGVSIRGDGSVDVSKIAGKYGGGGHPGSSGFFIPNGEKMPWAEIEE